jgi:segregation and condensation protein B
LYATTKQFLDDLSLTNLQSLPMLEDAAPMAAAEQLGQAVMEFDPSATVETVIELDENGQPLIQAESEEVAELSAEEVTAEEVTHETMEEVEEVTPESEEKSDEQK